MFLIAISFITLLACEKAEVENITANNILGEWRYVRTTKMLSSSVCYDNCLDFDYENSKYKIIFGADGKLTGNVNLLVINGKYTLNNQKQTLNTINSELVISDIQILNKPPQTEADTKILEFLEKSKNLLFETQDNKTTYNYLSVYNSSDEYLFFVRKK